jgi:hypothetical protein
MPVPAAARAPVSDDVAASRAAAMAALARIRANATATATVVLPPLPCASPTTLGRSVLLVDAIGMVGGSDGGVVAERDVYDSICAWVDDAGVPASIGMAGRRGAAFSGVTMMSSWARESPDSRRRFVQLALGLFNVWDVGLQSAIKLWSKRETVPEKVWSVLALTGGRPRDIEEILMSLRNVNDLNAVTEARLLEALRNINLNGHDVIFQRYVLPSMLNVPFEVRVGPTVTRFGLDIASRALLNADLLAAEESFAAAPAGSESTAPQISLRVPAISLRFARHLPGALQSVFERLVHESALRDQSKEFGHIWVLLLQTHLMLQHRVRLGGDRLQFWPEGAAGVPLGGPARPTGSALAMFAGSDFRESALFAAISPTRVFEARKSTIVRSLMFDPTVEPVVMVWHDLWTADVKGAKEDPLMLGKAATFEVAWQSPALVYFSTATHAAIDFMLLVDGVAGAAPHVYMFQCKARADKLSAGLLQSIVDELDGKLSDLFSAAFKNHVLRRAGIESKQQVTLCVAALEIGNVILTPKRGELSSFLAPPKFNVVLFDEAAFRALGGAALNTTHFMRSFGI